MGTNSPLYTKSTNLKKALIWMSEVLREYPEKKRQTVLLEAELRFDLTPLECEFLNKQCPF